MDLQQNKPIFLTAIPESYKVVKEKAVLELVVRPI
jgi:hypothetical protein